MKILFVIYQLDFGDHIAIPFLSAQAKRLGHECELCILKQQDLRDVVVAWKPDMVAFSANIFGFEEILAAHRLARAEHVYISILGGPQATVFSGSFQKSGMDCWVVGEGDEAFADILRAIKAGESYDAVPNVITARGANPVRPLIRDLDSLPFPDRDITLEKTYLAHTPKKTFYASRGCPYSCSYCCNSYFNNLYKGKGPIVRRFSVDRLLDEVAYVGGKYRMDFVKFGDDLFAPRLDDWLIEFCEKYPERIGIPFNVYLRFDTATRPMLKLLKNAGCHSVHLSVDSLSKKVREEVLHRRMKDVDIVTQLRMFSEEGINTWVNFMLAAPESTLEDDLATIEVSRAADVTYPSYSTTVCMEGTMLYDYAQTHGLIPEGYSDDLSGVSAMSDLRCFSEKEKRIRLNIYLLGAVSSKLPTLLRALAVLVIKNTRPNRFFRWIWQKFYIHSIENTIFKLR
ncbi:MAG: radical SAM protein [Rhodospirillales bacterium]|nr:radical SAM protein [Rhodospirillales bacterium]